MFITCQVIANLSCMVRITMAFPVIMFIIMAVFRLMNFLSIWLEGLD